MIFTLYAQLGKAVRFVEGIGRPRAGSGKPVPGHTLYHFWVSPYARKVRRAIYSRKLDIPFKDVLSDQQAWEELVRQGGKDQVPCLRIETKEGTRWMYESRQIIDYLERWSGR
jgi:glutathione S-transferase